MLISIILSGSGFTAIYLAENKIYVVNGAKLSALPVVSRVLYLALRFIILSCFQMESWLMTSLAVTNYPISFPIAWRRRHHCYFGWTTYNLLA